MIEIREIGIIRNEYSELHQCPANGWESNVQSEICLKEDLIDGLENMKVGDIIHVLWWFTKASRKLLKNKVGNDNHETGVFAMRSPHRPNPIALSLCRVLKISGNIITVTGLEALDGSPVIDIKKAIEYGSVIL